MTTTTKILESLRSGFRTVSGISIDTELSPSTVRRNLKRMIKTHGVHETKRCEIDGRGMSRVSCVYRVVVI